MSGFVISTCVLLSICCSVIVPFRNERRDIALKPGDPVKRTLEGENRKKVNNAPGSKVVKCNSCSRSMLVKNCFVDMSVNMEIEKDGKVFSVTAFPKVLTTFLKEDIFQYREDINSLEMKLLTLENVDFNLNQSGKIVKQLLPHSDSQEHQIDCNNTDATG